MRSKRKRTYRTKRTNRGKAKPERTVAPGKTRAGAKLLVVMVDEREMEAVTAFLACAPERPVALETTRELVPLMQGIGRGWLMAEKS